MVMQTLEIILDEVFDAGLMRSKWGIYRSLNDKINLRDEDILFTGFSIEEINNSLSTQENTALETVKVYQIILIKN